MLKLQQKKTTAGVVTTKVTTEQTTEGATTTRMTTEQTTEGVARTEVTTPEATTVPEATTKVTTHEVATTEITTEITTDTATTVVTPKLAQSKLTTGKSQCETLKQIHHVLSVNSAESLHVSYFCIANLTFLLKEWEMSGETLF